MEDTLLTEKLVDHMAAENRPHQAASLARALNERTTKVRTELLLLEGLGVVYRTGKTRAQRWYLG